MKRLYFLGKPGDGFGWGVANTNLVRELSKLCDVVVDTSLRSKFDAPVFVPVTDASLNPIRKITAPRQIGYCFTEWPLDDNALINARRYDVLFCGSTWNTNKLLQAGIKQAKTLIQGVDFDRFTVQPKTQRAGFIVFSGGKFEFRKGQDFVLAAMRSFMAQRADSVLLTAWHNPWPQTMMSMKNSCLINPAEPFEGLPLDRIIEMPAMPNEKTAALYTQAHVGIFPNRCEAGTNMVMCEFMACGRPVIASMSHGHADVLDGSQYLLTNGALDNAGWFNPNVSDIIAHLEHSYNNRDDLAERGLKARQLVERFTWSCAASQICAAAFR